MVNFPTSLDSLTNPSGTDNLNSPDHATQHANSNDIHEAMQAKVGVDSSTVTTSHDFKLRKLGSRNLIKNASFVDSDGDKDLISFFKQNETGIECGDTAAVLSFNVDLDPYVGIDSVIVAPC